MGSQATDVTYTAADGTTLHGYLAQPADAGVYPAVLMVHEWWGLNAEIVAMAWAQILAFFDANLKSTAA